jgi:GH15 family glucan-1,4-alpha-glucosidase
MLALMRTGYYDEAYAWQQWLLRAVAGSPHQMQIMYGLAARDSCWNSICRGRPVRIGNSAHLQLQLDVFGELLDFPPSVTEQGLDP